MKKVSEFIKKLQTLDPDMEIGGVADNDERDFSYKQELQLLIASEEEALEDVMSLLRDAKNNEIGRNGIEELKAMEPMLRANIQRAQLDIRKDLFAHKRWLDEWENKLEHEKIKMNE